ncbi:MAG: hypothetical protein FWG72_08845 [Oscillospiraceae bacterium]|nr:hypothetical protein [Oscillospiraceae bacterium]
MTPHEMFFDVMPTVSIIYKEYGFIPAESEICEISKEQYAAYKSQGGDISKKLYTVIPKGCKASRVSNEIGLLTEADISKLMKAASLLHKYAKEGGCKAEDSKSVLAYAAKWLPSIFTKGTRFARDQGT